MEITIRLWRLVSVVQQICRRLRAISGTNIYIPPSVRVGKGVVIDTTSFGDGSVRLGERSVIGDYVHLEAYGGTIEIGHDCSINHFSIVYGHGGVTIGNKVRIATGCVIIPANHTFSEPDLPIMEQPETRKGIVIGDDVWIAARVVILDGVTIGSGSVVAAGSVVNRNVAPRTVVGGVPARLLKSR